MNAVKPLVVSILGATMMLVAFQGVSAVDVSVGVEVNSVDDFYGPLSTEGTWVEVGSYGRCWHPSYVAGTWRPYCEGTWVWTDDGWYWQSDEPWGWACYHYGRWTLDPYYGWVWVPDVEWGPAWVCFRDGGGYCGWAPLPPGWHGGVAIGADLVPGAWFVFVGEHHFGERLHARSVIVNNTTIINRTTVITRTRTTVNHRVIADGPRVQDLQRVNRERIQTSTVAELRQHEKTPTIVHRPAPARGNEQRIQQPAPTAPERERPRNNPPEVIRGSPNPPERPPTEQPSQREPPPAEQPVRREPPPPAQGQERREPPPEQKQNEQHPAQPPPREKAPPPQERPSEDRGHDKEGEQGNGGR